MFKNFKKGFGLALGIITAKAIISVISKEATIYFANDREFMEKEKTYNPRMYEELKQYIRNPETTEES